MLLETRFGKQQLELDNVAAIIGNRRLGRGARVFLRDGQVLSGALKIQGLRFTENTGPEIELSAETLDRLVLRSSPDDGRPVEGVHAYVETYQGDRIAVAYDERLQVGLITPWGVLRVPLDEVFWFQPAESGFPGYDVRFKDGSNFFAYLEATPLQLKTLLFGNQSIAITDVRSLKSASHAVGKQEDKQITRPYVVTTGGFMLVGQVDLAQLQIHTGGEAVTLAPSQVRLLRNMTEEMENEEGFPSAQAVAFGAEIWGGSMVVGLLRHDVLPVRIANQLCDIPVEDIAEVHVPTPTLSDSLRTKINAAIRDLGHADWKRRVRATQELISYGYLAQSPIQEALDQTNDPEVRRRCETILAEIGD
jgi:hypothetical protein